MAIKLNKYYKVLTRSTVTNNWLEIEEFPAKKLAEVYLAEYSKDDGYLDVDLKIEVVYRWEGATRDDDEPIRDEDS